MVTNNLGRNTNGYSIVGDIFGDNGIGPDRYVVANGVVFYDWTRLCLEHAEQPGEWRDACLNVALVHAHTEKNMLSRSIAHEWAGVWLMEAGREDEIQDRLGRAKLFPSEASRYEAIEAIEGAMRLALTSPQNYEEYLSRRDSQGELGAARSIVAEIEEAMESGRLTTCN